MCVVVKIQKVIDAVAEACVKERRVWNGTVSELEKAPGGLLRVCGIIQQCHQHRFEGVRRLRCPVPLTHGTVPVDDPLLEVPQYGCRDPFLRLQPREQRQYVWCVDVDLVEPCSTSLDNSIFLRQRFDRRIVARLLISKLVARESQNPEAL